MSYDFNRGDTMNEIITTEVENLIYEIRGKQVMLSSDVANLYQVETKRINEAIKRNINRFPESFCFQLTKEELKQISLRSQFATLNKNNNNRGYNIKYLPYVLTEEGIMMLSGLLRSDVAVKVNVRIIEAFVRLRKYTLNENKRISNSEKKYIDHDIKLLEQDTKINEIFNQFKTNNNHIFFEGEIYDAYSLLIDILKEAEKEIIIIDNYAGKQLFDILKGIKINIKVVTKNIDEISYKKYKEQYKNIEIINNDKFHDRFIIIDKKILYHSGASFKDIGKKCFGRNKIENKEIIKYILKEVENE